MRTAKRIANLPPYLFAEIDRKKEAKQAQGVDVISLGIGDPDMPTPERIVDAMAKADHRTRRTTSTPHTPAPSRTARRAPSGCTAASASSVDPATEVLALIGSKEGIAHLFPAFVDPGDYTLVPGVGYPVYTTGGDPRRRRDVTTCR